MKQCPQEKLPENGKKAVGFPKPHFKPSVSAASGTQCCMQALTACGIETHQGSNPPCGYGMIACRLLPLAVLKLAQSDYSPMNMTYCMQALTACGI